MSKCLVIPKGVLENLPFWNRLERIGGKISSALPLAKKEAAQLIKAIEENKSFRERFGENGVENDPNWQQIGLYGVLIQEGKVFVFQRAGGANYSEERLRSKVAVGVGGHMESSDNNLMSSLLRELSEELQLSLNGKPYEIREKDVRITGVIKDEMDTVGEVHFGLVCPINLNPGIKIELKGKENINSWMVPLGEYENLVSSKNLTPERWADLVINNAESLGIL